MIDFDYQAPRDLAAAVRLMAAADGKAKLLAGGTDVLVQLREGLRSADLVVDVKKIPELRRFDLHADGRLVFGAGVACHVFTEHPTLEKIHPALVDSARIIGAWQIQSRASIGGNLCTSSPAGDSIPSLVALRAVCRAVGPDGARAIPVDQFCVSPGRNCLKTGELLESIEIPAPPANAGSSYLRFIPRYEMDIAVVGVGSWLRLSSDGKTIEDAAIALGAVAPTVLSADAAANSLIGKPVDAASFEAAAAAAVAVAKPISDVRGPAEYRKHLVGVFVRRTLQIAADRARGIFDPTAVKH
ncbi:MAG: FAD binding domain-containing protein [Planctomycetia bacterium]